MTTVWIDTQVEVEIEDVLISMEDEDLMNELRRRGVTAVRARERLNRVVDDIVRAYRERDDIHFGVLVERARSLAE